MRKGQYYVNVDRSAISKNKKQGLQEPAIWIHGPGGRRSAHEVKLLGEVYIVQCKEGEDDYPGSARVTCVCDDIEIIR